MWTRFTARSISALLLQRHCDGGGGGGGMIGK